MTEVRSEISEGLAALHGHWYGRGPSSARAYMTEDVVVVLLEETFTPAERELIQRQQADGLREMRRRFQTVLAEEFTSIVEQATGREVRSFVSDTDLCEDLSIEVFVLGAVREDMSAYEDGKTVEDPEGFGGEPGGG